VEEIVMTVKLKYASEDREYEVGGILGNSKEDMDKIAIECMARNLCVNSKINIPFEIIKSNLAVVSIN